MAYTAQADVQIVAGGADRLLDLCDHAGAGSMDSAALVVLARAQEEADEHIDSYARVLFQVPFSPVPKAIRDLAAAETVYRLKSYRSNVSDKDMQAKTERESVLRALEAGRWNPLSPDDYPARDGGETPAVVSRSSPGYTRDRLKDFG